MINSYQLVVNCFQIKDAGRSGGDCFVALLLAMTKIVYRITYNVYRLNTVASRKFFKGLSRGRIPLEYLVVSEFQKNSDTTRYSF